MQGVVEHLDQQAIQSCSRGMRTSIIYWKNSLRVDKGMIEIEIEKGRILPNQNFIHQLLGIKFCIYGKTMRTISKHTLHPQNSTQHSITLLVMPDSVSGLVLNHCLCMSSGLW